MRPRESHLKEALSPSSDSPPSLGGLRVGPALAGVLYTLLVAAAALALFGHQRPEAVPTLLRKVAPWLFFAFALGFSAYRLVLVRAGKYPAFKALFQIGAALLFFTLLLPSAQPHPSAVGSGADLPFTDPNPQVRVLAAEVARYRPGAARYGAALVKQLRDSDERVRQEAHRSLVAIEGQDLGAVETPGGVAAWEARFP